MMCWAEPDAAPPSPLPLLLLHAGALSLPFSEGRGAATQCRALTSHLRRLASCSLMVFLVLEMTLRRCAVKTLCRLSWSASHPQSSPFVGLTCLFMSILFFCISLSLQSRFCFVFLPFFAVTEMLPDARLMLSVSQSVSPVQRFLCLCYKPIVFVHRICHSHVLSKKKTKNK